MKILFINGSPNKNGNTAGLAETLLADKAYETLNLTDYKIYSYGQDFADDELDFVISKMKKADVFLKNPIFKKTSAILYASNSAGSQINFFHIFHI